MRQETKNNKTITLPTNERVFLTGLFAGLFSKHVCVVSDATDQEILAACNADPSDPAHNGSWTRVIRTQADLDELKLKAIDSEEGYHPAGLPGPCKECPDRIHMVVR